MGKIGWMVMGIALVTLGGCAKEKYGGELKGISGREADQLSAEHNQFEGAEDPPFRAETHFAAGQLAEAQGNMATAIGQYQQAIKLDPTHRNSLYRLGTLHSQMKQYPQAIAAWKQYLKVTGDSATAYSNLGFCQELAGQTAEAEESYRRGIEIDAKNRPCRVNYGLMLARRGRVDDGMAQLQAVLTAAEAHYDLGSVYEQLGKKDLARAEYRKALELEPTFGDAQKRLASLN